MKTCVQLFRLNNDSC